LAAQAPDSATTGVRWNAGGASPTPRRGAANRADRAPARPPVPGSQRRPRPSGAWRFPDPPPADTNAGVL